jgi:2-polyprenyl-6-methoxyphenol hydroxylase-like FAD-dependent oxidoreductase
VSSDRTAGGPQVVVVVGASLAGLLAAAAAAQAGRAVTVVERDELTGTPQPRKGVAQGSQPHVLLHRGLLDATTLLPGLPRALLDAGAVRIDTGTMPWFGPHGWQPSWISSFDVLSLTRPRLEHVVRTLVLGLPGVRLRTGSRVDGLQRDGVGWRVRCADGGSVWGDLVVDASGRGSRMPSWLAALGHPRDEPETVDANLGYASRLYRRPDGAPLPTGIVVQATPEVPRGGLGLPVEDGGWMVLASGYGADRPGRDVDLRQYLATLRDPVLAEVLAGLEPVGEVSLHRQTGNRRHRYGLRRGWPSGLLVVGDALCAFNPLYGQGIAVGAGQARVLRDALGGRRWSSPRVQRRLRRVADFPWSVATGEDLRYLGMTGSASWLRRLSDAWTTEVGFLLMAGDRRAFRTFSRLYHLMGSPLELLHPALVLAAVRRHRRPATAAPPRPAVVASMIVPGPGQAQSSAGRSGPPRARTVSSVSTSAGPSSGR